MEPKRSLFDITKEHLQRYKYYKATVERRKEQLAEIETRLDGLRATNYKEKVSGTPQGDSMTNLIAEKMRIENTISRLENICKDIERVINELPEIHRKIIEKRYYEEKPWLVIAYEVKYEERHCRRLRNEAIEKISAIFEQ